MQGDPQNIAEIETKIKYDEAIIRHLILAVKDLSGEDSVLLTEALENKNKRTEIADEAPKKEVKKEAPKEEASKEESSGADNNEEEVS
jgi:hypothetical protein